MSPRYGPLPPGCPAIVVLFGLLFLLPLFLAQLMLTAVSRLGLSPDLALLVLIGIFLGGTINIPVKRIVREEQELVDPRVLYGLGRLLPRLGVGPLFPMVRRQPTVTLIAVNLGGCLIPVALALYEITRVLSQGAYEFAVLAAVTALDVWVCYRLARPLPSVGIAMPALIPPIVAAVPTLLLAPDFAPPIAFTAGVLGPLIGADLLHLKEIQRIPTGIASIGGAGTFDGIVLSGMLAALLA